MPARHETRALWVALGLVTGLVIARSLVFAVYEHAYFDSDQAIVGLMAKHLAEGRALPLFFYGQTYMLGVEAWLAAPWIAAFGASVASLRASLVLTNLAVAWLLVVFLHRDAGLRPMQASAASLFFVLAPPFTAAQLVEAQGGNIEPFLFVLLLWWLRARPWAFGMVLALGTLNREFTLYAVPAIIACRVIQGERGWRVLMREWLIAAVAFVLVWEGVQALLPVADLMGPGTRGELVAGYAGSQLTNVTGRILVSPLDLPARVWAFLTGGWPAMLGGAFVDGGVSSQGRSWMGAVLVSAAAFGLLRIVALLRAGTLRTSWLTPTFGWFLLCGGVVAGGAYVVSRPADALVPRYFLLSLYAPIGLSAVWLALEPSSRIRGVVMGVLLVWAGAAAVDHVRYVSAFARGGVPNEMRQVADGMESAGVTVARSDYWTAYELTFLTGERVRVASTDFVRIAEYQRLAERAGGVPLITDSRCPGGLRVGSRYLCPQ